LSESRTYRLTHNLQGQVARYERAGQLSQLPPIITFQSVMDFTVSTSAIVSALYTHLPSNGSELVLFDVNRTIKFGPLLRPTAETALAQLIPIRPQSYRTTIITTATNGDEVVERTIEPGSTRDDTRTLGLHYPAGLYSLSHVALPFPISDALYGLTPDPAEDFGIHLGALAHGGSGTCWSSA
jgi:alpha-beta hydrolase superfamily lysophospholipase